MVKDVPSSRMSLSSKRASVNNSNFTVSPSSSSSNTRGARQDEIDFLLQASRVALLQPQSESYFLPSAPAILTRPAPRSRTTTQSTDPDPSMVVSEPVRFLTPESVRQGFTTEPHVRTPSPTPASSQLHASPGTLLANQMADMSLNSAVKPTAHASSLSGGNANGVGQVGRLDYGLSASTLGTWNDASLQRNSSMSQDTEDDELALLAGSALITELAMSVQEANTLVFEIQELRHTSPSSVHSPSSAPDSLSEVDTALMQLDTKLEAIAKEFSAVESQVLPILDMSTTWGNESRMQADELRSKWQDTSSEWEATQRDADVLGDELKEDKWLVVFRTVSNQAEEMMSSLEKILTQSNNFIGDLEQRRQSKENSPGSPNSSPPPSSSFYVSNPSSMEPLLTSFNALYKSLHAKVKYYSPACDRVLKILGKGIADRSTKNGEVLRKISDMKIRWRNLLERIARIEGEMKGVEEMLKDAASKVDVTIIPIASLHTSTSSPFRRFTSKISSRSSPAQSANAGTPKTSTSGTPQSRTRTIIPSPSSSSVTTPNTYPPSRPPNGSHRAEHNQESVGSSSASTSRIRAPSHHRLSQSMLAGLQPPASSGALGRRSPVPSADGSSSKPRWNISTKRPSIDKQEILLSTSPSNGRVSMGGTSYFQPMRSQSSTGFRSGMSSSRSMNGRASSPTFSNYSATSSTFVRERPSTPTNIPRPARLSTSVSYSPYTEHTTSILQRSMPASYASPINSPSKPPQTRLPKRNSTSLQAPRAQSPTLSTTSHASTSHRQSTSYRDRVQTPEPTLIAQAKRMNSIRKPYTRPVPPPVPQVPANHRVPTPSNARRGSVSNVNSRAPSAYGARLDSQMDLSSQPYLPDLTDPLDCQVASIVNDLPLFLHLERLDPPLLPKEPRKNLEARYFFSVGNPLYDQKRSAVLCKLIDRPRVGQSGDGKKVLVRIGGGFIELESYALQLLASGV